MSVGLKIVIVSLQKHWHTHTETHTMFYVMYMPDDDH
jgi:hypothetical protein